MSLRPFALLRPSGQPERVCYLHIGPHKTGTTTIQHSLFENAARLRKRGYLYPVLRNAAGRALKNHTDVSRKDQVDANGRIDLDHPGWKALSEEIRGFEGALIMSSEHFSIRIHDDRRFLTAYVDFFERHGFRVEVIAYVRDQPIWLNSWYTQNQKNFNSTNSFEAYARTCIAGGLMEPRVYLANVLAEPRVTLQVASFEQSVTAGLERDFLTRVGLLPDALVDQPRRVNVNAGAKAVYAARQIMRRSPVRIRRLGNYATVYETFKTLARDRGWHKTPYIGLTERNTARIRKALAKSNESFAQEFFGAPWAEVCPPRDYATSIFDPAEAAAEEAAEVEAVIDEVLRLIEDSRHLLKARRSNAPEP